MGAESGCTDREQRARRGPALLAQPASFAPAPASWAADRGAGPACIPGRPACAWDGAACAPAGASTAAASPAASAAVVIMDARRSRLIVPPRAQNGPRTWGHFEQRSGAAFGKRYGDASPVVAAAATSGPCGTLAVAREGAAGSAVPVRRRM